MPSIHIRLSEEQHQRLVVAAAAGGRSLQREIVRRIFGSPELFPEPQVLEHSSGVIDVTQRGQRPEHQADPKEKARMEHAPKERRRACEHRVPVGTFCKRCDV